MPMPATLRLLLPRRARRLVERNLMVYRRTWIIIFSGFFEPLLYLFGIGYGVGSLVGRVQDASGHLVPYAVFVAPALMATAAMNGAIYDSTFNLFYKIKYARTYEAILATPVGTADVALGEVTWALIRGSMYSTGFIVVIVALRLVASPAAILALPAAVLIGFSFASVGTAITTFIRKWEDFDLVQLALVPLFLFSATFFPITASPRSTTASTSSAASPPGS
jgi:lipooligosaccharide transport system permease protein